MTSAGNTKSGNGISDGVVSELATYLERPSGPRGRAARGRAEVRRHASGVDRDTNFTPACATNAT